MSSSRLIAAGIDARGSHRVPVVRHVDVRVLDEPLELVQLELLELLAA